MKSIISTVCILAAGVVAAAEPSVLEVGYKAPPKPAGGSYGAVFEEMLGELAPKKADASRAEVKAKAPAVTEPAKVVDRIVEKPVTNVVERIVERPIEVEKVVTVEKVVIDPLLEAKNMSLAEDNEQLRKELESEREKVQKLSRVLPKEAKELTGRPAKITSDTTVYNRKEGIASFEGHVHVDDEQYQMHADHVFLFFDTNDVHRASRGTNDIIRTAKGTNDMHRAAGEFRRVVAIGHVAITNGMRCAYGAKATYSKKNGLVVLNSGDGIVAEVRDESKVQDQIVRGKRIRFWIGSEQVEVDEADLTGPAPGGGTDTLKKVLGK